MDLRRPESFCNGRVIKVDDSPYAKTPFVDTKVGRAKEKLDQLWLGNWLLADFQEHLQTNGLSPADIGETDEKLHSWWACYGGTLKGRETRLQGSFRQVAGGLLLAELPATRTEPRRHRRNRGRAQVVGTGLGEKDHHTHALVKREASRFRSRVRIFS